MFEKKIIIFIAKPGKDHLVPENFRPRPLFSKFMKTSFLKFYEPA